MPDSRTRDTVRHLADLECGTGPPRWVWSIAGLDPAGRVQLPPAARTALGAPPGQRSDVTGLCHRVALVLGAGGAPMTVDGRGRVLIPAWLRTATARAMVVGVVSGSAVVVVAPTSVLDGLGDVLLGRPR